MTDPALTKKTLAEKMAEKLDGLSGIDLVEIATALSILTAGNSKLSTGEQTDIARTWLSLYYFTSTAETLKIIGKEILDEENPRRIKDLIRMLEREAQSRCGPLFTRAQLLSEPLNQLQTQKAQIQKEHPK
jgi:hypothetical protein